MGTVFLQHHSDSNNMKIVAALTLLATLASTQPAPYDRIYYGASLPYNSASGGYGGYVRTNDYYGTTHYYVKRSASPYDRIYYDATLPYSAVSGGYGGYVRTNDYYGTTHYNI